LPSPADLPTAEIVRGWHDDLVRASQLQDMAKMGPARALRIAPEIGSTLGTTAPRDLSTAATAGATATEMPASTVRRDGLMVLGESAWDMGKLRVLGLEPDECWRHLSGSLAM
jgi:hypothetical protein